jgi:hypothetical protein
MAMGRGTGGGTEHGDHTLGCNSQAPDHHSQIAANVCESQQVVKSDSTELKGRDLVELGTKTSVEGILKQNGHEWQLTSDGHTFDIHLGPEEYREGQGITIEEGANASVTGFAVGADIAVCSLATSGRKIEFRDENGRPAWAGTGRGRNRSAH